MINRRRALVASVTAIATLITAVGVTSLALQPRDATAGSPRPDTESSALAIAGQVHVTDGSEAPVKQTIDRTLEKAVSAPDAPKDGIPAVYYADDATLDDDAFRALAGSLTRIDHNLFIGNLTADQIPALSDLKGLTVSADAPLTIDPPVIPSDNAYDILWDTAVTVDDVSPGLAQARTNFGVSGAGQVIAVIDSGVDSKAIGLSGKVTYRKNFSSVTSKCNDDGYYDPYGHGTHVASIAAGSPSGGIEGVAPGAKLVDLRVFNCAGDAKTSNILAALNWVLAYHTTYHITVVNLSLASSDVAADGQDATSILVNKLVANGVFVSVAAGNSGDLNNSVSSPGTARYATTVGAANVSKYGAFLAPFSSRGDTLDLLAPGASIKAARSTRLGTSTRTIVYSGTSMAAPYVAGLAALALQQKPSRTPSGTVCGGCTDGVTGVTNGVQNAMATTDWFKAGPDESSGLGLVDAAATLTSTAAAPASSISIADNYYSDSPVWVRVPASDSPLTISAVVDASSTTPGFGDQNFNYSWYDASGDSSVTSMPCSLTVSSTPLCSLPNLVEARVLYFYRPASAVPTWLRFEYKTGALLLNLTAQGLSAPLTVANSFATGGVVDLTTATPASTTVTRKVADTAATTIDLVPSPGITVSVPSISVGQSVGNSASFTVSVDAAASDPPSSARIALQVGGDLVGVIAVGLPRSAAQPTMPLLASGAQQGFENYFQAGQWDDWGQLVSGTGTVFGNSYQPGIARYAGTPPASGSFAFDADGITVKPDIPNFVQPSSTSEIDLLDLSQNATTTGGTAVYFVQPSTTGNTNVAITNTVPVVPRDDNAWGRAFVYQRGTNQVKLLGGPQLFFPGGFETPTYYVNPFFWGQPKLSGDAAYVAYAAQYISGSSIKQGIFWEATTGTAAPRKVASGFNPTILSDGTTFGTRLRVVGTTATHVLVEYWPKGSTSSELRLYSVSTGTYALLAKVRDGDSTLSVDGKSIGYLKSGTSTLYCYDTATKTTRNFGSHGTLLSGVLATGNSCGYLVGAFRGTPALPPGSPSSQLLRLTYGAAPLVIATSAPDWNSYRWFTDRTGTKFATSTGASLTPGDTNGRVDLYPGSWGTATLSGTGTLAVSGVPGVGETLTATGDFAWMSSDEHGYQWYRGSTPISGATSATYKPTTSDVGKTVSVASVGTKLGSSPSLHFSNAVGPVTRAMIAGTPTISGTSEVGHTLSGSSGTWGPTGLTRHYQWNRDGVPISGATSSTYKLVAADAGASITFSSTATKTGYTTTTRTSAARVIKLLLSTSTPTIGGLGRVGQTLTLDTGEWGPAPTTLTYRWKRNGVSISYATGASYKLTAYDAGMTITVTVTGVKSGYSTATKTSAGLTVERLFSITPTPKISGTGAVGKTLTALRGTWSPTGATFAYQWLRNSVEIDGATAKTYVLTSEDAAAKISVRVVATKAGYTPVTKTSATKTILLELTSTPIPLLQVGGMDPGATATIGSKLQAVPGSWGPGTVKLTYQWKRNGVAITGATYSYHTLSTYDYNQVVTVTVTGTKTGYGTIARTSAGVLALKKLTSGTPTALVNGQALPNPLPTSLADGAVLSIVNGTWTSGVTFSYAWLDCGVEPIPGQTSSSYTVDNADLTPSCGFVVRVTGSRAGYQPVAKLVWLTTGAVG